MWRYLGLAQSIPCQCRIVIMGLQNAIQNVIQIQYIPGDDQMKASCAHFNTD